MSTIATIRITDLQVQAIVGTNKWERTQRQKIILNIRLSYNAKKAVKSDNLRDALDYKGLKQKIIRFVESSRLGLLEALTAAVLDIAMQDKKVLEASVKIDKTGALRYARTVSVEMSRKRRP